MHKLHRSTRDVKQGCWPDRIVAAMGGIARGYRTMAHSGWQILFPAIAITLSVLAINQVGDGLSRVFAKQGGS